MPYRRSEKAIPLALAAGAFLLALLQRPGLASSDTKIDLHVDPVRFLGEVASVWSPTGSLGHVQGGQYGGYVWPMGPFFALGHELGLAPWLVQRLWLGLLLALGAWGVVRLLDALLGRPRGVAHAAAGVLFAVNPYVVVFASRASFTLLAYAALPWLLLCVHRGLGEPRRWWWPAAFALVLTSTGGGVNAAVTAWLLPGPLLLWLYEPLVAGVPWASARRFGVRTLATTALASIWWAVPLLVQSVYGVDFLQFTEQVGSIWGPSSLSESLRLMGYWPSYLGVGYGDALKPYFGSSPAMLFDLPVVVATLVVPGLALAGFSWTRRWRYGPFFLALVLVGLIAMSVGFPDGTPLRRGATFAYDHLQAIQFLRTTNKAGPLVALGIACLGGAGLAELWRRLGARPARLAVAGALAAALVVLAALPLFQGRAVELTWKRIPAAWKQAAHDLDRGLARNTRAVVLPGQEFAFYRWGGTVDPILPALTKRPVAIRNVPPYADLHATDLFWTVDGQVQQQRLVHGALAPLLDLMGTGAVVTATDDDYGRSGGMPPVEAARELARQGLAAPSRAYGPRSLFAAPPQSLDPPAVLPQVRRYDRRGAPGIVRVEPAGGGAVVDGSADGLVGLASFGALGRPLLYAGDLSPAQIAAGRQVTISDSNRRRSFLASRPLETYGWTLPAGEPLPSDAASLDPFSDRGSDGQTVAVYRGARYVKAPFSAQIAQFPEHRPYAAFDGDPSTSWLADPILPESDQWIEIGFDGKLAVPYADVLVDSSNPRYEVTRVEVAGRQFRVHPGWNRLRLGLGPIGSLRVAITGHRSFGANAGGAGGFREIRVPGLHVRELLRPPVLAEHALAGRDLRHTSLTYLFQRTTADDPFRQGPTPPPPPRTGNRQEAEAALIRGAQDPERSIDRVFSPPAARTWRVDGWATVAPDVPDSALDRLVGVRGARLDSSGRYQGRPSFRASSAFDGAGASAWVAPWYGHGASISWSTGATRTLRTLTVVPPRAALRRPSLVRVRSGTRATPPVPVAADGTVRLPQPLRGRAFTLDVLRAAAPSPLAAGRPAVAIAELRGASVPRVQVPRSGAVRAGCGALAGTAGGRRFELDPAGSVAALDAGEPLRAQPCGAPLRLAAGTQELHSGGGVFRPLMLRLRSPAPLVLPSPVQATAGGRVLDPGTAGRGSHDGVKVSIDSPSWLVLGESWNRGWHATCNGHDLGAPKVVDAFANGWHVGPGCRDVAFTFRPQRAVTAGYIAGAVACLVLLALLLLTRPRRLPPLPPEPIAVDDAAERLPLRAAIGIGALAAVVFGFVFALRAGVAVGPAVALILWRGVATRSLILAAGGLLAVAVPALYVIFPGDDRGGYDTRYAIEHLGAHWVVVAAYVLLVLALARTIGAALRRPRPPAPAAEPAAKVPA